MRDVEIRLKDLFFYMLVKWKFVLTTLLIGCLIPICIYMTGDRSPKTVPIISEDRIVQLDHYAKTLANIQIVADRLNEKDDEKSEDEYLLLADLSKIEWNIRDIVSSNTEKNYLDAKVNAIKNGKDYSYVPQTKKSQTILLIFPFFAILLSMAYCYFSYINRNPFAFNDTYGWNQFFVHDSSQGKLRLSVRGRLTGEKIYNYKEIVNILSSICRIDDIATICVRDISKLEFSELLVNSLNASKNYKSIGVFSRAYADEKSVDDYYSASAFVLINRIEDKIDREFIKEYEQNDFIHDRKIFVITLV